MDLKTFAKKHAGGAVRFKGLATVDMLPITDYQIVRINELAEEHGKEFVSLLATETLVFSRRGTKLSKLTRREANDIITAVVYHDID